MARLDAMKNDSVLRQTFTFEILQGQERKHNQESAEINHREYPESET